MKISLLRRSLLCAAALSLAPIVARADTGSATINSGDCAWMLISAALVLLMTPGLALFYGGMVRGKNVLSVLMQSFLACGLVSIIWVLVGYSLAFGPDHFGVIGDLSWCGLNNVSMYHPDPYGYAPTIPHLLFMIFQMTFAIITPALVSGAIVERMKFSSYFVFIALWSICVYAPIAHMIWAHNGILGMTGPVKAIDFAGGTTVEVCSGVSALVMALVVGKRRSNHPDELRPHNLPLTMVGTALLWFGWFGFNAGSAQNAGPTAVNAFVCTHLAAAGAATTWLLIEWSLYKKPSVLGFASGAVAGMVAITPAAGFVRPMPGLLIGIVAAGISFYAIKVKNKLGYDDSLDVFAVHGCAGFWGLLANGLFATIWVNKSGGADGLFYGHPEQLGRQLIAAVTAVAVAGIGTFIVAKLTGLLTGGLRSSAESEDSGLDVTEHGEVGYSTDNGGIPAFGGAE
jgi:Amt family ammonium transporter